MVTSEILGLFVNTLAADDKCSSDKRQKFSQAIQMQWFKQPKIFYEFFIAFLQSASNFEHLQKKPSSKLNYTR